MLNFLTSVIPAKAGIHFLDFIMTAPLPNPSGKTTKHLTRPINYISQVIANPACGRGANMDSRSRGNDGV